MMLDLRAIENFPARVALEEDVARLDISAMGLTVTGKARAEIHIVKSDRIYYCTGEVVCDARIECSRCLEPYPVTLRGELDFSIHEMDSQSGLNPDDIPETEILIPAGETLVDVSGPVREGILLEVPLKPLCSESCKGLCPQCGTNRNETDCECHEDSTDPRWDGLRDLTNKSDDTPA